MLCARPCTYFISFRLYHKPLRWIFLLLPLYKWGNGDQEAKQSAQGHVSARARLVPDQGTPEPLCFTVRCQCLGCLGLQLSVAFPTPAALLPPVQIWTLVWLGSHLEFQCGLFPQLYGRHKEYLNSLVGTDFETVSSWVSVARAFWLQLSDSSLLKVPKTYSSVDKSNK